MNFYDYVCERFPPVDHGLAKIHLQAQLDKEDAEENKNLILSQRDEIERLRFENNLRGEVLKKLRSALVFSILDFSSKSKDSFAKGLKVSDPFFNSIDSIIDFIGSALDCRVLNITESLKSQIEQIIKNHNLYCTVKYFKYKVDWDLISVKETLSEEFIRYFQNELDWSLISQYQKLSESFIREFKDRVHWNNISRYQQLSESFIREFKDKVYWLPLSRYQNLSESFIREFKDKVDWFYISIYQQLSEDFIREFKDKVDWSCISRYQKLSESFIRDFKGKVDWGNISVYQKFDLCFAKEFNEKIDLHLIGYNNNFSDEFRKELFNLLFSEKELRDFSERY